MSRSLLAEPERGEHNTSGLCVSALAEACFAASIEGRDAPVRRPTRPLRTMGLLARLLSIMCSALAPGCAVQGHPAASETHPTTAKGDDRESDDELPPVPLRFKTFRFDENHGPAFEKALNLNLDEPFLRETIEQRAFDNDGFTVSVVVVDDVATDAIPFLRERYPAPSGFEDEFARSLGWVELVLRTRGKGWNAFTFDLQSQLAATHTPETASEATVPAEVIVALEKSTFENPWKLAVVINHELWHVAKPELTIGPCGHPLIYAASVASLLAIEEMIPTVVEDADERERVLAEWSTLVLDELGKMQELWEAALANPDPLCDLVRAYEAARQSPG